MELLPPLTKPIRAFSFSHVATSTFESRLHPFGSKFNEVASRVLSLENLSRKDPSVDP